MGRIENVIFQSRVQCGAAQNGLRSHRATPTPHEVGTDQARELVRGEGDEGRGCTQSLQTGVMKYQLSEWLDLPSGRLAKARFKFTLWTAS